MLTLDDADMARLLNLIEFTDDCWLWTGPFSGGGYVQFYYKGKKEVAHRVVWKIFVDDLTSTWQLDHLCRTRNCVNPDHLEVVTPQENTLRGFGPSAINARKTHCVYGHEFTVENTYLVGTTGERRCKRCVKRADAKRWREGKTSKQKVRATS